MLAPPRTYVFEGVAAQEYRPIKGNDFGKQKVTFHFRILRFRSVQRNKKGLEL